MLLDHGGKIVRAGRFTFRDRLALDYEFAKRTATNRRRALGDARQTKRDR